MPAYMIIKLLKKKDSTSNKGTPDIMKENYTLSTHVADSSLKASQEAHGILYPSHDQMQQTHDMKLSCCYLFYCKQKLSINIRGTRQDGLNAKVKQ